MRGQTKFRDHCRQMAKTKRITYSDDNRALWTQMADEIDTYLAAPPESPDLFGELSAEPAASEEGA
jgi:hypothetical protein